MYKISKEFNFSAAHRLVGHKGLCLYQHGHNYRLIVSITGSELNSLGMVIDFGDLKKIVNEHIIDIFDHSLILWKEDPILKQIQAITIPEHQGKSRIVAVPFNPTAENFANEFCHIIAEELEENYKHITEVSIQVFETPSSSATSSLHI